MGDEAGYKIPPPEISDLVKAEANPTRLVSPPAQGAKWFALLRKEPMLSLDALAEKEMKLAGVRFWPHLDVPSRRIRNYSLQILNRKSGAVVDVQVRVFVRAGVCTCVRTCISACVCEIPLSSSVLFPPVCTRSRPGAFLSAVRGFAQRRSLSFPRILEAAGDERPEWSDICEIQ